MSEGYAPTTEDVKLLFSVYGVTGLDNIPTVHEAETMFDRWLAEACAEAWALGYQHGQDSVYTSSNEWPNPGFRNPYREEG